MISKPYIGITGPASSDEVQAIAREFDSAGITMNSTHIPMIGYLISYKTLNGQPTNNRRYPKFSHLPSLVKQAGGRVLTMMHYNSREQDLAEQVKKIFKELYEPGICSAIQLNIAWPDPNEIKKIKQNFRDMQIVLQLSSRILAEHRHVVAHSLKPYQWDINYVLIDPSGGRAKEFDLETSIDVYQEVKRRFPHLMIGFAGGLNGANVDLVTRKLEKILATTDFCIDAEGGLRDRLSSEYGDDLLNLDKVKVYLKSASTVLR